MPFTFSHPAIILPLLRLPRRYVSATGLIAGSLSPDFEYFIRMSVYSVYSHTVAGLFYFCLPVSIILSLLYHQVIRNLLITHLPNPIKWRLTPYAQFHWLGAGRQHWPAIVLSMLVGAASHLLWDGFTHRHGFFVAHFTWLQGTIGIPPKSVAYYQLLQHISSLIGAGCLYVAFMRLPKRSYGNTITHHNLRYWVQVGAVSGILTTARFVIPNGATFSIGNFIVTLIGCFFCSLVLVPFCWHTWHRLRATTPH